jgi:hypothetical protein
MTDVRGTTELLLTIYQTIRSYIAKGRYCFCEDGGTGFLTIYQTALCHIPEDRFLSLENGSFFFQNLYSNTRIYGNTSQRVIYIVATARTSNFKERVILRIYAYIVICTMIDSQHSDGLQAGRPGFDSRQEQDFYVLHCV